MSAMNVETAYQQSMLANAAYIQWDPSKTNISPLNQLIGRGFTEQQATEFLRKYTVNGEVNPNGYVEYNT